MPARLHRLLVSLLLPVCALGAPAAELVVGPQRDATIFGGPGYDHSADGAGPHLWTSVIASGVKRRALVAFDLSAIPPGARIDAVELRMYQSRARDGHEVSVYRLLETWGEGSSDAGGSGNGTAAMPGDSTWINRFHPGSAWQSPGGSRAAQASDVALVGAQSGTYAWSGAALLADVQRWVNEPAQNHGWLLIGDERIEQNAKRFESRQFGANGPQLRVVYTPPATGGDSADIPLPPWAWALLGGGMAWHIGRSRGSGRKAG
jgi:hypothetical protein